MFSFFQYLDYMPQAKDKINSKICWTPVSFFFFFHEMIV